VSAPTFPRAWEAYYDHLQAHSRTPDTISVYRMVLYDFTHYLATRRPPRTWDRPTPQHLTHYLNRTSRLYSGSGRPRARGGRLAANTRNGYAAIIRAFYRFAYDQGLLPRHPLRGFVLPKPARPIPRALELADVDRAMRAAAADPRMTVMIWLMFGCGLRAMEVADLEIQDLRLHAEPAVLHVRQGKGGKPRIVPVAPAVAVVLRRYLDGLPGAGPVVASLSTGRALSRKTVCRLVSAHLRAAGIRDSSHALRHTFATELLKAGRGANLYAVSKSLGHSSTRVTEAVYVASYLGDLAELARQLPDPRGRSRA
jgi:site-specific recombinase XerD